MINSREIALARQGHREKEQTRKQEHEQWEQKHKERKVQQEKMLQSCCRATTNEYTQWLHAYLSSGGKITHVYECPMKDMYIVKGSIKHLDIVKLCGALAVSLIIPSGVSVNYDNIGHNCIYLWDGLKTLGHSVPLFSDIK